MTRRTSAKLLTKCRKIWNQMDAWEAHPGVYNAIQMLCHRKSYGKLRFLQSQFDVNLVHYNLKWRWSTPTLHRSKAFSCYTPRNRGTIIDQLWWRQAASLWDWDDISIRLRNQNAEIASFKESSMTGKFKIDCSKSPSRIWKTADFDSLPRRVTGWAGYIFGFATTEPTF